MSEEELNQIAALLAAERWTFAKTMPGVPHEYIVRGRCAMSDAQFESIVRAQRTYGQHEVWGKYYFPYLYVDGYKYWTMGDAIEETVILNRQKVFSEFDGLNESPKSDCNEDDVELVAREISALYGGRRIFEVGHGCGSLLTHLGTSVANYRGCDPSSHAIEAFRSAHPEYAERVVQRSFEECYHQWKGSDEVIVATLGTPNYIMLPYLKMLAEARRDLYLMFYRDGYCPEPLRQLHHFNYSLNDLRTLFDGYTIEERDDYVIVKA
jgi:hypothetical protein